MGLKAIGGSPGSSWPIASNYRLRPSRSGQAKGRGRGTQGSAALPVPAQ